MLYVPGNRSEWVRKAAKYGADAVVIDFEDSVPDEEVPAAREALAENAQALRDAGQSIIVLRPNEVQRGGLLDVAAAAAAPAVDLLMVPKSTVDVIKVVDRTLDELGCELPLLPIIETPEAMVTAYELGRASRRNIGFWAGSGARNGDPHRFLGFDWSVEGQETLFLRSKLLLDARANGFEHIIGGAWVDLDDKDGLCKHVESYRVLGYTGYVAIHPGQVEPIHETLRPSEEEIAYAREAIETMRRAEQQGQGAIRMGSDMIDYATVRMAERVLALAER
ncbi:CoA ester lyase [Conexibacter sp. CPCC 206217]|uniref:HpcH/HpaI aldolase/citrate lyase family protein n=1 Tax=Conexibacter sp. CPCC 206217 TaxID=3064574 RepID=UPI002724C69A|nr:CoA ester lyase [Conexibacter sp. CPCC 206217]MDO8208888.1 CoA ester lyase [Conexibacter sp. CPCC 206217]